jgi:glycosyltransferase involved in cell wall biosynthesis
MIEAMACGTPVIAWHHGSTPEIVEDGITGVLVGSIDQAVSALDRLDTFDHARIRSRFELRFSVERMARDYISIYRRLTGPTDRPAAQLVRVEEAEFRAYRPRATPTPGQAAAL